MLAAAFHRFVSLALPPRCPGCGVSVADDHQFCAGCWAQLRFLGPPWCASCNLPFAHDRGADARCAKCLVDPPRHAGVRAAVAYGPIARRVALRLKYGRRPGAARTMAAAMARLMPPAAELLVPVPLHRWRLWSRGYNQAALIADALSRSTGIAADALALRRIKATPPLREMGPKRRADAVRGAFAVERADLVRGRAVVLIDDVHTSGATADACAAALIRAGAASVSVLCWSRVVGDEGAD